MSDYSDLDDEVRPHLLDYVREVIRLGYSFYPERDAPFWPQTLQYWRHREAFYVAMVRLYAGPDAGDKWGLSAEEVEEYKRIRNDPDFTKFDDAKPMLTLDDIDIRCGDGWRGILQRFVDDINRADLKVHGVVAEERSGHLSLDYNSPDPWIDVARVALLAECRSYYTCDICGQPGEHRGSGPIWRSTRCQEHRSPNPGRLIYDQHRTPWREMSDGRWRYDPAGDTLICIP